MAKIKIVDTVLSAVSALVSAVKALITVAKEIIKFIGYTDKLKQKEAVSRGT